MIKYLHIENIAVIEKADIEFSDGFNALTGETGAGKSIVIDSINAILGERTSRELIRSGCQNAVVSAAFGELNSAALDALREYGYSTDGDGCIVVNRTLTASGKSSIRINSQPATAGVLREIAKYLINIHGQHDNQRLLDPLNHCGYIDALANNGKLIDEYYAEFKRLNTIRKELEALETDEDEKQRRTDILNYQINELETAAINVGELETLKEQFNIARNYEKTMDFVNHAYYALNGDENTDGAVTLIENAERDLSAVSAGQFETAVSGLNDALCSLEAVCSDIRNFTENTSLGELDPEKIQDRLDFLQKLTSKYGGSEESALEYLGNAQVELEKITFSDKRAEQLGAELDESTERLVEIGQRLTMSRTEAARRFEKEVTEVLTYLDMPSVRFTVSIEKGRYTKRGCDTVEFLISANAGEEIRPLHKIASGGELSRIMLAIKSVLSDTDAVDTLIFDEIDAGISGRAAGKVGIQLKKVSVNKQVICVTHLAQIAADADNHLLIQKITDNGRTFTSVTPLSYNERIGEIARIMSGGELTENLFNSAKELIDRSRNL